jgi:DNA-binding response OmpR family regulator
MTAPGKEFMPKPLVLVVEDEPLIALSIADALEDNGFKVAGPFADADSALEYLQTESPDVAVLDFNLGERGDSSPIAEKLALNNVPFMMLSSYNQAQVQDKLPVAPTTWLTKPVNFERLASEVRKRLDAAV